MTPRKIVEKIKSTQPHDPIAVMQSCRLPLEFIGDGAYRTVYRVVGTNVIIKFAGTTISGLDDGKRHGAQEYATITNIRKSNLKRHKELKKHLPVIYHFEPSTGVTVGRYYKLLPESAGIDRAALAKKFTNALKICFGDIDNTGNVGKDGRGTLKILDAGCIIAKF